MKQIGCAKYGLKFQEKMLGIKPCRLHGKRSAYVSSLLAKLYQDVKKTSEKQGYMWEMMVMGTWEDMG